MDWYIAGSPSSLYEAIIQKVSALEETILSLDLISHHDGEFDVNYQGKKNSVLIQLPYQSSNETIGSAIVASRIFNCMGICLPYMPYARSAGCLASLLKVLSVPIITLDIHQVLNGRNLINLDASLLVASYLNAFPQPGRFVLAPDHGASIRAQKLAFLLKVPFIQAIKIRNENACHIELPEISECLQSCIIVDDILDTGNTIFETIRSLHNIKINHITAFVTHLLPLQDNSSRFHIILKDIQQLITTDVFHSTIDSPKLIYLSVADLLLKQIQAIFEK